MRKIQIPKNKIQYPKVQERRAGLNSELVNSELTANIPVGSRYAASIKLVTLAFRLVLFLVN
jgi:hypothetical protein